MMAKHKTTLLHRNWKSHKSKCKELVREREEAAGRKLLLLPIRRALLFATGMPLLIASNHVNTDTRFLPTVSNSALKNSLTHFLTVLMNVVGGCLPE